MGYPKRGKKGKEINKDIYIFCEGTETEVHYFNAIKQLLNLPTLKIQVKGVGQSSTNLLTYAVNSTKGAKNLDSVWIVFDRDSLSNDEVQKTYRLARKKNVGVAFSNCSFEVWLLLHFEKINFPSSFDQKIIYRKLEKFLNISKYENHKNDVLLLRKIAEDYSIALSNNKDMLEKEFSMEKSPYCNVCELIGSLKK